MSFSCEECERRLINVEKSIDRNIDELKTIRNFKEDYSVKTAELVVKVDGLTGEVKKLCEKLSVLTDKGGQDWDKAKWIVITAVITAILSLVFTQIGLK